MADSHIGIFNERRIVLGVTGSIAAYKAVDLASKLTQAGAEVDVIMTEAAQRFLTPLTFQAVTGRSVSTSLWDAGGDGLPTHIAHVGLAEAADLLAIIPATADVMSDMVTGKANDLLRVTAVAARCPVLVAPAMDGGMYGHPATQANVETLRRRGVVVLDPDVGRFASGLTGKGRLPGTDRLLGEMRRILGRGGELAGRKVVVTAGGTREALDPVRFITNHSSGKQGRAVAQAAIDAGADVTLISAARDLPPVVGAREITIDSAQQMLAAVLAEVQTADVLIMSAAISDYRPAQAAEQKIKKPDDPTLGMTLDLARNPDILMEVKEQRSGRPFPRVVVGFAAESQDLLANATKKLGRKGLDLIVANDITASDAGFRSDTNRVIILDRHESQQEIQLSSKTAIAEIIISRVAGLLGGE